MYLIITKDSLFMHAMQHLLRQHETIHITCHSQICATAHRHAKVIIDTLTNNIFYTPMKEQIESIEPSRIFVFSPFKIKRVFGEIPTTFIDRKISILDFIITLNRKNWMNRTSELSLSRKQHQVLTCITQQKSGLTIANELCISLKTFYSHKYNIMLLLKLRKMSDLMRLNIVQYLN